MNDEYRKLVNDCAIQGQSLIQQITNQGSFEALYLHYRPSEPGKGSGKLMLARDSAPNPENLPLVTGEGLRCNIEYSRYYDWVYSRATRAPIMSH